MIPVFLDSARKHKNLARTYKNWLPDVQNTSTKALAIVICSGTLIMEVTPQTRLEILLAEKKHRIPKDPYAIMLVDPLWC
jgi:hypothetical protein